MITVTIRVSGNVRTAQAMPNQNIGEFLAANNVNTTTNAVYLQGAPISPSVLGQTFAQAGISGNALVSSHIKTANAK